MGRRPPLRVAGIAFALAVTVGAAALVGSRGDGSSSRIDAARPLGITATPVLQRPEAIVVRARSLDALPEVEALARSLGYTAIQRGETPPSLYVELPSGKTLADGVTDFTAQPGVLYAEPAYPFGLTDVPTDPLFSSRQQAYLSKVRAPEAWDITTGRPEVIVAVLDTGIDLAHPDLQGRIWRNAADPPNGADDDGNGCVDDVNGCAFLFNPSEGCNAATNGAIGDDVGHGTFVSGIIAASGDGSRDGRASPATRRCCR